ncbi:MAG: hypothetical protein IJR72_02610 [Oscillospiraceae bacterium]|nr:hypothetical protein [Oscillospiraceae bacterium]
MNVGTIVVFQRDGRCQVRYRETDSEPFRVLETEEAVTREALREMWKRVLYDLQASPDREPFRLLFCTDYHRENYHGMFPDLGCPRPWSRGLLEEAMSQGACAGEWSVNGEILSPGDFREVFPRKSGEKPLYVYTVPEYRMPESAGNVMMPESFPDTPGGAGNVVVPESFPDTPSGGAGNVVVPESFPDTPSGAGNVVVPESFPDTPSGAGNVVVPEPFPDTPGDGEEYDALSVLVELLRETNPATETALEQGFDMMEVMREISRG